MKTIIVATDFSRAATHAAEYAAAMAENLQAGLILIHIYPETAPYSNMPVAVTAADMQAEGLAGIKKLQKHLSEKYNGLQINTMVKCGLFVDELQSYCELKKPFAVVIGSQGRTGSEVLLFGSNAVAAMRKVKWPIISVPPGATFKSIKEIGIASDMHDVSNSFSVETIKTLAEDFKAAIHVINTESENLYDPEIVSQSRKLNALLAPVKPSYHFLNNAQGNKTVIEFANTNNIDLLIVFPKSYGFFENLFHKSHTKDLVLHSPIPLMALHV